MNGVRVTRLASTPVKGMRLDTREDVVLERSGVRDNRRFYLVDARERMVNGKQLGELNAVVAEYDDDARRLALTLPDGTHVDGTVELGPAVTTRFFSLSVDARLVMGPWSEAVSEVVGQHVRLVEAPAEGGAVDRGTDGTVTLISEASLEALTRVAGRDVDARRFRMLIEVCGVAAHDEDAWVGRRVQIGDALVALGGHVGRCIVTSRHPETGEVDLPTLDLLASYRRDAPTTEPLAFGVYGEVLEPGRVRVGDVLTLRR